MKKLLVLLAMLILIPASEATAQGSFEVKVYPVVDCQSFAFETLDPEHPILRFECKDPELVFTYTYYSQSEAREFARGVAHQGLERYFATSSISSDRTTPNFESSMILYPTIKKITVRHIQDSNFRRFRRRDRNDPVPCLGCPGCVGCPLENKERK